MAKQITEAGLVDPGQPAPGFELPDQDGKRHALDDYKGRWLVLYFYPKDDTSGCTKQACLFRDQMPNLEKTGAAVVGVSPDDAASHRKFMDKHGLNFDLLADPDHTVCERYGVWQEKRMYGRVYWGVVRTTYLIDGEGVVACRWDKVRVDGHAEAVREKIAASSGG